VSLYRLSPRALADLDDIMAYGCETWGFERASAYTNELRSKFALLAKQPGMGRPRDEFGKGVRCFGHRNHLIFFMVSGDGPIDIIGVPHQSMDIETYFDEDDTP